MAAARSVRARLARGAASPGPAATEAFSRRHRFRTYEALPWLAAVACYFLFPSYLPLAAQILATILFALSADLVLGYAGIVTLGQAAFFGAGAYIAGLLAAHGWGEPITGLLAAAIGAAAVGFLSGLVILRSTGLTLLMQTLVVAALLGEAANKASAITGGDDGLQGMQVWPVFGHFEFGLYGRTAFFYCLAVLFLCWLAVRRIVHSAFGRSLTGIRENVGRMHAIGAPVAARRLTAYTISAALAGISGGLVAQTTGFVGLDSLDLERSGHRPDHADHRRRRPALWRLHRRPALHDRAGPVLVDRAGLLVLLDRPVDGRARHLRPRRRARPCRQAVAVPPMSVAVVPPGRNVCGR